MIALSEAFIEKGNLRMQQSPAINRNTYSKSTKITKESQFATENCFNWNLNCCETWRARNRAHFVLVPHHVTNEQPMSEPGAKQRCPWFKKTVGRQWFPLSHMVRQQHEIDTITNPSNILSINKMLIEIDINRLFQLSNVEAQILVIPELR